MSDYLPGLEPGDAVEKQPHQMSPEEFAMHPNSVFHITNRPYADRSKPLRERLREMNGKPWNTPVNTNFHVGTYRSAIDRHSTGFGSSSLPARLYVGWVNPAVEVEKSIVSDAQAQTPNPDVNLHPEGKAQPYLNKIEDPGAMSMVLPKATDLKTHADFVERALAEGKEDEVHPQTLAMYRAGALTGWRQPHWMSQRNAAKVKSNGPALFGDEKTKAGFSYADAELTRPEDDPDWGPKASHYGLDKEHLSSKAKADFKKLHKTNREKL
jgi:hypothetical protein